MAGIPVVRENIEHLSRLLQEFRNSSSEKRVHMLLLLRSNPDLRPEELARTLGRSGRTIQRWIRTYQLEGLDALLQPRTAFGEHHIDDRQMAALGKQLQLGGMETLEDIRLWLKRRFNLLISKRGVSGILSRLGAKHIWTVPGGQTDHSRFGPASVREQARNIQSEIVEFLRQFPVDASIGEWCREVREILQSNCTDVDRITISVNARCDLLHPGEYNPTFTISQTAYPDHAHKGVQVARTLEQEDIAANLIREFKHRGYPVDQYHPPHVINLTYKEAYLGTIFLWRGTASPPISDETLELFAALESFLVFSVSDAIMRHHYTAPIERVFYTTLREVAQRAHLTPQEYRVITFRLLGYMYKEIASELNISQDSVKKTLQNVYRKSETGSHIEFFAKYFTSGIVPPRQSESSTSGLS